MQGAACIVCGPVVPLSYDLPVSAPGHLACPAVVISQVSFISPARPKSSEGPSSTAIARGAHRRGKFEFGGWILQRANAWLQGSEVKPSSWEEASMELSLVGWQAGRLVAWKSVCDKVKKGRDQDVTISLGLGQADRTHRSMDVGAWELGSLGVWEPGSGEVWVSWVMSFMCVWLYGSVLQITVGTDCP